MALSALAEGVAADRRGEMEALGYAVFPSAFDAAMVERLAGGARYAGEAVTIGAPEPIVQLAHQPAGPRHLIDEPPPPG